jgi:transcriptional regulator with XRE-family HTH domain
MNMAKPLWESGKTPGGRFAGRLRSICIERGLTLDSLVRLSPRFKHPTATRWWFGTRLPKPTSIVDLAKALQISPTDLIRDLDLGMKITAEVEAIMRAEM